MNEGIYLQKPQIQKVIVNPQHVLTTFPKLSCALKVFIFDSCKTGEIYYIIHTKSNLYSLAQGGWDSCCPY